ncbi:hypothetical protein [Geomonas agri]|uniref:hypothetical protein n=1 Tax=Geomonas agri TaxID=2873702 RepID=UPI001CD426A7|nr:hypothetical protein [Geomonas agri]
MSVNPWSGPSVDAAFNHYDQYVQKSGFGFNEKLYSSYFPNYDIQQIVAPGFKVAEYVHTHYFKQFGTSDVKNKAWSELSEWYHRIILTGAMVAYKLIEKSLSNYNIDAQCNNVHSLLIDSQNTDKMVTLFHKAAEIDGVLFQLFEKQFYRLMDDIRGTWIDDGQLVATIMYRNFHHGYFGLLLSNTYLKS